MLLEYIPSHVGHPWNELVDIVAAAAGSGLWPVADAMPILSECGALSDLAWAWLRAAPDGHRDAYPHAEGGGVSAQRSPPPSREQLEAQMRVPAGRGPALHTT